jgi:hypothetical protein
VNPKIAQGFSWAAADIKNATGFGEIAAPAAPRK